MRVGWAGKVITTYRLNTVVDPDTEGFSNNVEKFGELTSENATTWKGYLAVRHSRHAFFKSFGATASDHSPDRSKSVV